MRIDINALTNSSSLKRAVVRLTGTLGITGVEEDLPRLRLLPALTLGYTDFLTIVCCITGAFISRIYTTDSTKN